MILSAESIVDELDRSIKITPFNMQQVNPNSYNLRLHNTLLMYDCDVLDARRPNPIVTIVMPETGYTLIPGQLYIGSTIEYTETNGLVPMLEGRSSIARLGITVHASAGFGDNGFRGCWTLEISVVKPVIVYPGMEICQICYHTVTGGSKRYGGKYQGATGAEPSKMFQDRQ